VSRSPSGPVDPARPGDHDAYVAAFEELNRLIRAGRPFSGHEPNCAFLNTGGRRFATVSAVTGLEHPDDGRALARVDWDHDGDLDLWYVNRTAPQIRLMRNDGAAYPGLTLRLVDRGANRDAIGGRVTLHPSGPDPRPMVRGVRAGEGYLSASGPWVHFGLGPDGGVDRVRVRWPDGAEESFEGVLPGGRFVLERGTGVARSVRRVERPAPAAATDAPTRRTGLRLRVPFRAEVPLPTLGFTGFDGDTGTVPGAGVVEATLVQLWASWCAPCIRELTTFTRQADRLREAGVRVVALSVDGVGDDHDTGPADARSAIDATGFPFEAGMATTDTLATLAAFQRATFGRERPFPVPTSLLLDADGIAAVLYKGEIDLDVLLADVAALRGDAGVARNGAMSEPGTWLEEPPRGLAGAVALELIAERGADAAGAYLRAAASLGASRPAVTADPAFVTALADVGQERLVAGADEEAASWFAEAVRRRPSDVAARLGLGRSLGRLGQHGPAEEHLRAAVAAEPSLAAARHDLAVALASQGRRADAIVELERAVDLEPARASAWILLGNLRVETGEVAGAVRAFRRAAALRPEDADARVRLGSAAAQAGDLAGAEAALREALALDPDAVAGRATYGMILEAGGRTAAAAEQYRAALARQPSPLISIRLARILATDPDPGVRDGAAAERIARDALEGTGGRDPEALAAYAAALAEQGRYAEASETAFRAVILARDAGRPEATRKAFRRDVLGSAGRSGRDGSNSDRGHANGSAGRRRSGAGAPGDAGPQRRLRNSRRTYQNIRATEANSCIDAAT
jgi:Flp pilus assembly protein TadD/thiol-disulfide isomerase/thioredoxin